MFEFDPSKPRGSRILSAKIGDEPIDEDRKYVVATRGYMARGKGAVDVELSAAGHH